MFGTEVETIQSGGEEQAVNEEAKHNLAVKFHPTYSIQFGNQSGWQIPECYSQECSDYVIGGEIRAITKYRSAPREKHSDEWRPNVRPCLGQRSKDRNKSIADRVHLSDWRVSHRWIPTNRMLRKEIPFHGKWPL